MTEIYSAELAVQVRSAQQSDTGQKRSHNEDFAGLYEPVDSQEIAESGCLYAVADGVGGSYKGEKSSKYAVEKVLYAYYHDPETPPAERLRRIMRGVGNDLYHYAGAYGTERMGTTLVAAVVHGNRLLVANVGDSRAYLIRGGQVRQITRDHNQISDLVKYGILSKSDAVQSRAKNLLTRSLGGFPDVEVDVFDNIPLLPGDLLLLCTDGLHRYLNDPILVNLTRGPAPEVDDERDAEAEVNPEAICQKLVAFANQAGGSDNITALLVSIQAGTPAAETSTGGEQPALAPVQGPVSGLPLPRPVMAGINQVARLSPRSRMIAAGGLIGALVLLVLCAALVLNLIRLPQPDKGVVLNESTAAPTATLGPAATLPPTLPPPPPTAAVVEQPTQAETPKAAAAGVCVSKPTIALQITLEKFGAAYNPQTTYEYTLTCDANTKVCEGKKEIKPGAHGDIKDFWYILIPEVQQEVCESKQGLWVMFK